MSQMLRKSAAVLVGLAVFSVPAIASAHVIVTPGQVGIGDELTFNVSVPNERDTPVTNLKLLIPNGVTDVTPTEKDGWTITADKSSGSDPEVTDLVWSGDTIPVGQREDFSFSAQAPANATSLDWKAYQTYGDGTIVHWDQKPAGSDDATGDAGPYSVTKVVNDLSATTTPAATTDLSSNGSSKIALIFSLIAVILAGASLLFRKK